MRACQLVEAGASYSRFVVDEHGACLSGLDGGGESGDVIRAVMSLSIDEEGGCAGYPAEGGGVEVFGDPGRVGVLAEIIAETIEIKVDLARVADEIDRP